MRALCVLAVALMGCTDGVQAPYTARIDAPDDYEVSWSAAVNGAQDGYGLWLLADFYVYDSDRGMPLEKIQVELSSGWNGLYILPEEAVQLVDPPELPPDVTSQADIVDYCTDDDGNFDNSEEWCSWYWDESAGEFYEFGSDYADAGGYSPNYASILSDNRGLARAYLYLDYLPVEVKETGDGLEYEFFPAQVVGSIGVHREALTIEPAG